MSAPFPHRYRVRLDRSDGPLAVLSAPPRPAIQGGAPPEFDGRPEVWSPEHLLLSAVALCLLTTFQALAARADLVVTSYEDEIHGVLEKRAEGIRFTSISHRVAIRAPAVMLERTREVLESAKKHCIVANALNVPVGMDAEIEPD